MVFKEMVAYLLNTDTGKYTCGSDVQAERNLYDVMLNGAQDGVNSVKADHPDWTTQHLQDYSSHSTFGSLLPKIEDCLRSHGYDISNLPHVSVPEFGDISSLVLRIGMTASLMTGLYLTRYLKTKFS